MGDTIVRMASWVGSAHIFAAADYLYQRWEFEQSIMMSKRRSGGTPADRRRSISALEDQAKQRQLAASRMMAAIPLPT